MADDLSKGFTGIEINGVRFSNLGEMLCYMDKQRDQLTKAKELLLRFIELKNKPCAVGNSVNMLLYDNICAEVKQFLNSEVESAKKKPFNNYHSKEEQELNLHNALTDYCDM